MSPTVGRSLDTEAVGDQAAPARLSAVARGTVWFSCQWRPPTGGVIVAVIRAFRKPGTKAGWARRGAARRAVPTRPGSKVTVRSCLAQGGAARRTSKEFATTKGGTFGRRSGFQNCNCRAVSVFSGARFHAVAERV